MKIALIIVFSGNLSITLNTTPNSATKNISLRISTIIAKKIKLMLSNLYHSPSFSTQHNPPLNNNNIFSRNSITHINLKISKITNCYSEEEESIPTISSATPLKPVDISVNMKSDLVFSHKTHPIYGSSSQLSTTGYFYFYPGQRHPSLQQIAINVRTNEQIYAWSHPRLYLTGSTQPRNNSKKIIQNQIAQVTLLSLRDQN